MDNDFDIRYDELYNKSRIAGERTVKYDKRGRLIEDIPFAREADIKEMEKIEMGSRLEQINEMTDGAIDSLYTSLEYKKKKIQPMFKRRNRKYMTEQIIKSMEYALSEEETAVNFSGVDLIDLSSKLYNIDMEQAESYVSNIGEWAMSDEGIEELTDRLSEALGEEYIITNSGMIDEGMVKMAFLARVIAMDNIPQTQQETEEV